ncbi:MAG: hypothetical protein JST00_30895 [Deltaproteobacteria bacterium]|nr:hypothetical protein [Deltaproteobacteria bacterium]
MSTLASSFPSVGSSAQAGSGSPSPSRSHETRADVSRRLARLDSLLDESTSSLRRMYEGARAPRIGEVEGPLRGRMLGWPMLDARPGVQGLLRAFAGSASFPWRGKTFRPREELAGEGINRVFSERFDLFRFETFIARSRAGDFDALQLDYDLPSNPPVIRSIKDEIRELEPGLWLGQAYLRTKSGDHLWLYFALART